MTRPYHRVKPYPPRQPHQHLYDNCIPNAGCFAKWFHPKVQEEWLAEIESFLHPSKAVDLPPIEDEAWDKVHYALYIQSDKGIFLIGLGDTINECKNNAIATILNSKVPTVKIAKTLQRIGLCNLNESITYEQHKDKLWKMSIMMCEGKVFIFGQRYGNKGMKLLYEPNSTLPYLRYAGYDDGYKGIHFNSLF